MHDLSIILPMYNEAEGIGDVLRVMTSDDRFKGSEIIVVDDGSTDDCSKVVMEFENVRLISHPRNLGYGSALVSGMRASSRKYLVWMDSDGQHTYDDVHSVATKLISENLDYVIGVRDSASHQPVTRRLGKAVLRGAVRLAASQPVNDFNSGLRGFRTELIMKYLHLLTGGFGASTTTTLLMLERRYLGAAQPITVLERVGTSSVRQVRDGFRTLLLVVRILLLFRPLAVFFTLGLSLVAIGMSYGIIFAINEGSGFPVLGAVVTLMGFQTLLMGLIVDQISSIRRERFEG